MKAVYHSDYGSPDVLHIKEVDTPTINPDEVLVRVQAASVNFGDLLARNFGAVTPRNFTMPGIFWLPARLEFGFKLRQVFLALRTARGDGPKVVCALSGYPTENFAAINELVKNGAYQAFVDCTFPMDDAPAAHRYAESGSRTGSVVIMMG